MSIRRILTIDNAADLAVLKQVSTPVEGPVTDDLRRLMDDMLETMYDAPGIGLAAVQIGDTRRVIVMDLGDRGGAADDLDPAEMSDEDRAKWDAERRNPRFLVNPEIVWASDEMFTYEEGCLSVPEYFDSVERPARVRLKYLNYDGHTVEEEAAGLYAVCIQHEMDHLEGVLFIDHLSRLKRDRAVARVKKNARLAA
ncbi:MULTISPECIES: peptide deformylase [unclassified Brevundimonas]|uniref:peptide deformylase n=1 Tax=unclassified Brevundimonas TaxID=2622653 RepID=UPI000700A48C|nr:MULTISPECIES: peptide deformylase [unclassified Brevundimonas]KQY90812.1 peptide deformylase [Brevundimonas sp. Root1423]KRA28481.1 peptide deformylase [Brevundimonas sp. Root608]